MNKKFSTLVAGMLLATTVGTGYAQTQDVYTKATAPSIEAVSKVTDGRAYQLLEDCLPASGDGGGRCIKPGSGKLVEGPLL